MRLYTHIHTTHTHHTHARTHTHTKTQTHTAQQRVRGGMDGWREGGREGERERRRERVREREGKREVLDATKARRQDHIPVTHTLHPTDKDKEARRVRSERQLGVKDTTA